MKLFVITLICALSVNSLASENIKTGSEVLMSFNYGLGCKGVVLSESQSGYIIKFEPYTSDDGVTARNCSKMSEELVSRDRVEIAVESNSVQWGGVLGFWIYEVKVGDMVLTKRAHNFCPGVIGKIINKHAKVNVDPSVTGCGLMKDYLIHLDDVVVLKDIASH